MQNVETPREALEARDTATDEFFVREHFERPAIDPARHRISVSGLVTTPRELSVAMLQELPQRSVECVLECAGNSRTHMHPTPPGVRWGDGAVGNAVWEGPRLADILRPCHPRDGALEVVFTGADRGVEDGHDVPFERALPLEVALSDGPILALTMNGEPLTAAHGAPVRLIVPGWYAVASVKWLVGIEVVDQTFAGFFQRERYVWDDGSPVTHLRPKCAIDSLGEGDRIAAGRFLLGGRAWGGEGGIVQVCLRIDDGPWLRATLHDPERAFAWRRWRCELHIAPGAHTVTAVAIDAKGNIEPLEPISNALGYGYNTAPTLHFTAVRR
jgi:DMSO/TMAO reductase YedYZ molybdopterin-dependent catalytic subunit